MGEKRNRDTAIIGIAHVTWLLVMHGRIHDLQELSVEIFLRMRARGVNHDSIQIIEVGIAETCLR